MTQNPHRSAETAADHKAEGGIPKADLGAILLKGVEERVHAFAVAAA